MIFPDVRKKHAASVLEKALLTKYWRHLTYRLFANSLDVDLSDEAIKEEFYLPFLREYNRGHLQWLKNHSWEERISAFSAIERLDNLDYTLLRNVAISIDTPKQGLTFFNVHIHVNHFDELDSDVLRSLWLKQRNMVEAVFQFIANYQMNIWHQISDKIFASK